MYAFLAVYELRQAKKALSVFFIKVFIFLFS